MVLTAPTTTLNQDELVSAMVGDVGPAPSAADAAAPTARRRRASRSEIEERLVVSDIVAHSSRGSLHGASLVVRAGERVGVTGLLGAGVATLGRVIVGGHDYQSGSVVFEGEQLQPGRPDAGARGRDRLHPRGPLARGIRRHPRHLREHDDEHRRAPVRPLRGAEPDEARRRRRSPLAKQLSLVSRGLGQPVEELSGGNQQKVTVARALASEPRLIVAITPTRGVDVASKELLLAALADMTRATGASLLLASDEFDDLQICDRVVVLVRGQVFTEFTEPPFDARS